jgi:hypothetical protein
LPFKQILHYKQIFPVKVVTHDIVVSHTSSPLLTGIWNLRRVLTCFSEARKINSYFLYWKKSGRAEHPFYRMIDKTGVQCFTEQLVRSSFPN